jgi:hypothetical protein
LNVKQISVLSRQYPAVVIHSLANARTVLATGHPVTLLSARGAALFAGSAWWRALVSKARDEFPNVAIDDILDCADAPGLALSALRLGQRALILEATAPGWPAVASVAASLGGELLAHRPAAIDMSNPVEARRLRDWLQVRTTPDDSGRALS